MLSVALAAVNCPQSLLMARCSAP